MGAKYCSRRSLRSREAALRAGKAAPVGAGGAQDAERKTASSERSKRPLPPSSARRPTAPKARAKRAYRDR